MTHMTKQELIKTIKSRYLKANKREKGKFFENIAVEYLVLNNYKIIERNFYTKIGEIDLICEKENTIIFFEIKGGVCKEKIFELLNKNKINRIKKVANIFLSKNKKFALYKKRIDALIIIAMEGNLRFLHYKNI